MIGARWFLLLSVLAGSFFSRGEGVQLFPFPDTDERGEKGPLDLAGQTHRSYTFSVHNQLSSIVLKANSLKKAKKDIIVDRPDPDRHFELFLTARSANRYFRFQPSFDTHPVILKPSDRGPPSI